MKNYLFYFPKTLLDLLGVSNVKRYQFFKRRRYRFGVIEYGFFEPGAQTSFGLSRMKFKDWEEYESKYFPRKMKFIVDIGRHSFQFRII